MAARSTPTSPPAPAWTCIPRIGASAVVQQLDEDGCGPACGEMLLRDRGRRIDQREIGAGLALPIDGPALAQRLRERTGERWVGGALDLDGDPTWDLVHDLCEQRGSWAALLEPSGPHRVGHWVVVDAVTSVGVVLIRDPAGLAYGTPITEFLALWRYTVLVVEVRPS